MKLGNAIKIGAIAATLILWGYLLGSGTIGEVLNIGESKIGAGSTRADADQERAIGEAAVIANQNEQIEARNCAANPNISYGGGAEVGFRCEGVTSLTQKARAAFAGLPDSVDQDRLLSRFVTELERYAGSDRALIRPELDAFLQDPTMKTIFDEEGVPADRGPLVAAIFGPGRV